MEKIDTATPDLTMENEAKLLDLFPQVATEVIGEDGEVSRAVDFDALRELLGDVAEGQRERYQFTWPGKQAAKEEARKPISKTLRPCPEKSIDWDTTENLYIEGDNLEALKLLRETYAGKVKLIYIDPPYNTGHDFVYDDDFAMTNSEYIAESGEYDEEGGRLVANTESNGRFHSDWCSMMYPRLLLARDLLRNDGVLLMSIDDHELTNLKKIADELFGASSHVATFLWTKTATPGSLSKKSRKTVEYILAYEKMPSNQKYFGSALDNQDNPLLKNSNPIKSIVFPPKSVQFRYLQDGVIAKGQYENGFVEQEVVIKNYRNQTPFRFSCHSTWQQSMVDSEVAKGTYFIAKTDKLALRFQRLESDGYKTPNNLLSQQIGIGTNESASTELSALGFPGVMDYPKPVSLISFLVDMVCHSDEKAIIIDFFSGSATTAHAVIQLNAEDGCHRKFILVQLPEVCGEDSEAYRAGYSTICEIGEERIRRAGAEIKAEVEETNKQPKIGEEPKKVPDVGFRVLRIDSSNFNDVSAAPDQYEQTSIDLFVDNLKPDRSDLDILFQVLPKFRIPLSAKIEELDMGGKTVFNVNDGQLVACFSNQIDNVAIERIAQMRPLYAVFRDACLADDATAANLEELFKTFSPDTVRRVI